MAVDFGPSGTNTTRYYSFADDDRWNLSGSAAWTIFALLKWDSGDNAGNAYQYYISTGDYFVANKWNLYVGEASQSTNKYLIQSQFGTEANRAIDANNVDMDRFDNGLWTLIGARHDGTYVESIAVQQDDTVVIESTTVQQGIGNYNGGTLFLGGRNDAVLPRPDPDRFFQGEMQFLSKVDYDMPDDELLTIAHGIHPFAVCPGNKFAFHFALDTEDGVREVFSNATPTKNGTGWVTTDNMPLALGPHWVGAAYASAAVAATAVLSMATGEITEGDMTARDAIITLTGATWISTGFADIRRGIINLLTGDQSGGSHWDEVKDQLPDTAVTRTSATVVTIDLDALDGVIDVTTDEIVSLGSLPPSMFEYD